MTVDSLSNIYVGRGFTPDAGLTAHDIIKISPRGTVTVVAGTYRNAGVVDGLGTNAQFTFPRGLAVDSNFVLYVADAGNRRVRTISPTGAVSTLASRIGSDALVIGCNSTLYVLGDNVVRAVTLAGNVSVYAGGGGATTAGYVDGVGTIAKFQSLRAVAADTDCVLYVATGNMVRKVTFPLANVTTMAGSNTAGYADGAATQALFQTIIDIAVDRRFNVYVFDFENFVVRRISGGFVTSIYSPGPYKDYYTYGVGWAATTELPLFGFYPGGIAVDDNSNLYVLRYGTVFVISNAGLPCTPCAAGTSNSTAGALVCGPCSPGSYSAQLKGGVYSAQNPGQRQCQICSAGQYSSAFGASECTTCAAGSYSNITGASSSLVCTICGAGSYATTYGVCALCTAGTYSSQPNAPLCTACAGGSYATVTAATSSAVCTVCAAGSFTFRAPFDAACVRKQPYITLNSTHTPSRNLTNPLSGTDSMSCWLILQ